MSIMINPPPGPWTVADLDRIPDAGFRFEIHEGNLVMMSPATLWHSQVIRRLANALEASGLPVSTEVGVKRSDRSTRIADVAIFKAEPTNLAQAYWAPADLSVVIEVVSDGSEDDDHMYKPLWYAQAGIPGFWRVEQGEDGGAVIYKHKLARTTDGHAAYIETGVTTLSALESGS